MKYKVGDKVRIVSKWGDGFSQGAVDTWLGKVMTIKKVFKDFTGMTMYNMEEDNGKWAWDDTDIEGLASTLCVVISSDGKKTFATLYEGFESEARFALDRLFDNEEKEKKQEFFNGKVVCVKECVGFTVGKIYEFIDGKCSDDQNTLRSVGSKLKDLDHWGFGKFLPIVE